MAKIGFSDATVRSFQPPLKGQTVFWDSSLAAFGCRVSQGGSKTFIVKHANTFLTIGRYGIISLSEARTEAKRMMAEFTLGKIRPQSITYEQAVKVFLDEKGERRKARTVADHTRHLRLLKFQCQLADVSHQDLERKLKRLPPSEFNHRLACAKTFFTWAQRKRYITDNPTMGLTAHTTTPRSRVLTDEEIKTVWTAAGQLEGHFGTIVKLLIATGQRRGEIAALQKAWITNEQISLPATVTKNGRPHTFPIGLNCQSTLTNSLPKGTTPFLFPARNSSNSPRPFNGWSKSKATLDKLANIAPWTLHDLRRTYRSTLPRLGIAPHICERLVNHISSRSQMEQTYDHYAYWDEMKAAVQKHDSWLSSLVG